MKVFARGDRFYINPGRTDSDFKGKLRYTRYNSDSHLYYTLASPATLIDILQSFPSAFDHGDDQTTRKVYSLKSLVVRLDQLQEGITEKDRDVNLPESIDYVWQPYQHQKEAIAFGLNIPKCALWLDMGLGKTFTSITLAKLRHVRDGVNNVLVVVPKSLIYQWESEINTLAPDAKVVKLVGTLSHKDKVVEEAIQSKSKFTFYIITYESIGTINDLVVQPQFDMFILDEATKVKNPDAQRTIDTKDICSQIKFGIELTGMAYVNSPLDLYSQLSILDPTIYGENKWAFANHYIVYKKIGRARVVDHYINMNELKKRAYLIAFSRTKSSCFGLPEKVYQVRKLCINTHQFSWYDNLVGQVLSKASTGLTEAHRGISKLDQDQDLDTPEVTVEVVVAMLEKLTQITSGFVKADTGEYIWLDSAKYDELIDIIQSSSDSFIIWAKHTYTINKIAEKLKNKRIYAETLTRSTKDDMRRYLKERFKAGKVKVLILQIQSECRGNDFTCQVSPVTAVFFENTPSIEERYQAEDRQHRIGMTGSALYIDLICEDTYDEGIQLLLKSKKTVTEYIREKNLDILLGKGGSVEKAKTKGSKKIPKRPADVEQERSTLPEFQEDFSIKVEGLDDL